MDRHSQNLRAAGKHLKDISSIDTQDWNLVKLAGALKLMLYPEEEFPDAEEVYHELEYFVDLFLAFDVSFGRKVGFIKYQFLFFF